MNDSLENGQNLPLRASGEFLGYKWEFRGDVIDDLARQWLVIIGADGNGESGSIGPLPFADIGWKTLGHIGSYGWSSGNWLSREGRQVHQPSFVSGVISQDVAKILVLFRNGVSEEALKIESGHSDVRFFLLPYHLQEKWAEIVAFDAEGGELDRVTPF